MAKNIIQKSGKYFTTEEKHKLIKELFIIKCSKAEIWRKYTGYPKEHGQILRWMRKLGYLKHTKIKKDLNLKTMQKRKPTLKKPETTGTDLFENLQLKKRIIELEKQLKDAEIKAIAFSTMVDIAEAEFKIPIRKKLTTKP
jgi:hypothetical protein